MAKARFYGTHNYSMDRKGRVSIPAEFREIMQEKGDEEIVLTISPAGENQYLLAVPESLWEPEFSPDLEKEQLDEEARSYRRFLMARMEGCPWDKQGRILIPSFLRDYAGLTREVSLVGTGKNSFEIWDRETFEKHYGELDLVYRQKRSKPADQ